MNIVLRHILLSNNTSEKIALSNTQADSGWLGKKEQEEVYRNHIVHAFSAGSPEGLF